MKGLTEIGAMQIPPFGITPSDKILRWTRSWHFFQQFSDFAEVQQLEDQKDKERKNYTTEKYITYILYLELGLEVLIYHTNDTEFQ